MRLETLVELKFFDSSFSSLNPSIRAFRAYPLVEIRQTVPCRAIRGNSISVDSTPGLHNKIPAQKIFARGWVAQRSLFSLVAAKIFQGLGPKRRESCKGDRVYSDNSYLKL